MSVVLPVRLGERLAVRYFTPEGATEAVGEVIAVDATHVTVLPDGAEPVVVSRAAIAAARAVPPRVVRPVSPIEDVETLAARGWPGAEQERLGGWLLRAGCGASGRANSALPAGDPGLAVGAAVDAVQDWYAARGLPPQIQLPEALGPRFPAFRRPPEALTAELSARGWVGVKPTLVMVGDVRRLPPRSAPYPLRSSWADAPDERWWELDGAGAPRREEALAAPARYLTLREQAGGLVAAGRLAVVDDWCGLTNLTVSPAKRGRGHGRRAVEAMLVEGARHGVKFVYLQVTEENAVARALYDSHGLALHHRYRYWSPAPAEA